MKNRFPFVVALVIGILAIFSIYSYVKKVDRAAQAKLKGQAVVAARTSIEAGAELTLEMVAAKEVPDQFIPAQAIKGSAEVKQIIGRKTRVAIKSGQLILWSDLASEARGGLSSAIPAGEGAFSVSISKGVKGNLIQPGDHIDVIGLFALPKPNQSVPGMAATWRQGSDMVDVVLLQNVTVLAVGDTFGGVPRGNNVQSGGELTLSLTLQEAQLLMFAGAHGELGAVLRREGAVEVKPRSDLPKISFEAIDKIVGDLDERRAMRLVEVQKGSRVETVPVMNATEGQGGGK